MIHLVRLVQNSVYFAARVNETTSLRALIVQPNDSRSNRYRNFTNKLQTQQDCESSRQHLFSVHESCPQ